MAVKVVMPTFGMTEGEATVVKWLKEVGDPVKADELILVVETEKATLEVPAPADGVLLKIVAEAGDSVALTSLIGWIGQAGESIPDARLESVPDSQAAQQSRPEEADQPETDGWVRASPLARRIARENNLDLVAITGTGPNGRVMEADVRQVIESTPAVATETTSSGPISTPPATAQPVSKIQQLTAARMAESFRTAPHFYLQVEIDASRLVTLRAELLPDLEEMTGLRLTYTDLLLYALSIILPRFPLMNGTWAAGGVETYSDINLGLAVAAPPGLMVPVIRQADRLSLVDLVLNRHDLIERAKENKLTPPDMSEGTFTLTNLGMYGIDSFMPILNPPQSAILAVGAIKEKPIGVEGRVELRPTMNLTLAVDHRVADGAYGAEFMQALHILLESPLRMLAQAKR